VGRWSARTGDQLLDDWRAVPKRTIVEERPGS
jgi:hypothetical protein